MKTKVEVESTPIFKIVKRALTRKYPWIKDLYVGNEEDLSKYSNMIFLDMDIDAMEMAEQYGWTPMPWITQQDWGLGGIKPYYESAYITTMVGRDEYEESKDIQNDIENEMRRIQRSNAIPSEYQINKTFGIGQVRHHYPTQPTEPDNTTITN